jgi:hypothetical protein
MKHLISTLVQPPVSTLSLVPDILLISLSLCCPLDMRYQVSYQ